MGVKSMTDSISAKVIADSVSPEGKRITTFELEYHRYILAELNTHAMTARNTASSRAIPIQRMIDLVMEQPVNPVEWGRNRAGMQATETLDVTESKLAEHVWDDARRAAVRYATDLMNLGVHKQVVNRLLEPFQKAKTVLTATELNNFFTLRLHKDAQPEIRVLAERMKEVMDASTPNQLQYGEWHTPYFDTGFWSGTIHADSLEDALAISSSCCAQVSYRKLDQSIEKALDIYHKLVTSKPVHASAFAHCATPIKTYSQQGVTHERIDDGTLWSGQFQGWVQYRQLIEENYIKG